MLFMPQSPRHLINRDRDDECLATIARLRSSTTDDIRVRIEFLEMKAMRDFERVRVAEKFPQYQDGSLKSGFMIGFYDYMSLVTDKALFKRTVVAVLTMVFQQWNGVSPLGLCLLSCQLTSTSTLVLGQRHFVLRPFHL